MKLFVLGLPHTQTTREFATCAFTQKAWNLCKMLHDRGHEVIHLGVEGSDPPCTENIAVVSADWWRALYPPTETGFYNLETSGEFAPYQAAFADGIREAIAARGGPEYSSIVCVTWGGAQRVATDGLTQLVVESGIGYAHPYARYRVYESYAWMHRTLGRDGNDAGNEWYHCVIPNAFDPDLFGPVVARRGVQGSPYFLYLGRLNHDKGVGIAAEIARAAETPLKIVGQGDPTPFTGPGVTYHPPVSVEERRELLRHARALICPTRYVEPFGGVAVEAMMSGTPAISTDWGAFTETIRHGVTGYRCRTFEQFVWAAKNIERIDPEACRRWAVDNFSLDCVGRMYEEFFRSLLDLNGGGWYATHPERTELDWLQRT